jgi:hypothetical protein
MRIKDSGLEAAVRVAAGKSFREGAADQSRGRRRQSSIAADSFLWNLIAIFDDLFEFNSDFFELNSDFFELNSDFFEFLYFFDR